MNTFTEENYLKAIYKLSVNSKEGVSTNSIAEILQTKAASVTDMLKKLSDKKLINYQKYQGVSLTDKGIKIALNIVRKHRLWEAFLVEKLNFKWDQVHTLAEELEHINSDELIDRLDKFLGYPKFDPHGDPIPDHEGKFANQKAKLLSELPIGKTGVMIGVVDHSPSFLQYLDKLELNLGRSVKILEAFDFDNSLSIIINGKKPIHISNEVSKNILVSSK